MEPMQAGMLLNIRVLGRANDVLFMVKQDAISIVLDVQPLHITPVYLKKS